MKGGITTDNNRFVKFMPPFIWAQCVPVAGKYLRMNIA